MSWIGLCDAGLTDYDCDEGQDESAAIAEAIAETYAALTLHRAQPSFPGELDSNDQLRFNGFWTAENGPAQKPATCTNIISYGQAFVHGMWEMLWGLNCGDFFTTWQECDDEPRTTPHSSFGWVGGASAARTHLTKALAFALDNTGSEPTFNDITLTMFYYFMWEMKSTTVAANFINVMDDHNLW